MAFKSGLLRYNRALWLGTMIASLLFVSSCKKDDAVSTSAASSPGLSKHPIYSQYQFSDNERTIKLGTQPLYFPTGLITAMMERDNILQSELSRLGRGIEFYPFLKGNDVNFFVKEGKLDAGVVGDMPVITIAAERQVVIPILIQHGFTSIVAKHPMQLSDLRGGRIAYAFGSNAHFTLLTSLASEGIKESDVTLVPMDISEMSQALASGQIDAFSGWEPTPAITLKTLTDSAIIRNNLSTGFLYFTKSFADDNPEVVSMMVAAELRAINWINQTKENLLTAADLNRIAEYKLQKHDQILSSKDIVELAKNDILGLNSAPIISEELIKTDGSLCKEFDFLKELKNKWQSTKWEDIKKQFDSKIISAVLKRPAHYRIHEFDYDLNE